MSRAAPVAELLAALDGATRLPLYTARPGGLSLSEAYFVADAIRARRLERGERAVGYKIGFTNRGIWPKYRVHAPIWAPIWDRTVEQLDGPTHAVSLAGLVQPRIEPEIVFGFAGAPRAGMNDAELLGCLGWVAHGFEIVQTHFDDWRFEAPDTVVDFGLHGRLIVGPRVAIGNFEDPRRDLAALHLSLLKDGRPIDAGNGRAVLDGPVETLRLWIDAMHAQQPRWPIEPGDIVTTGTLTDAWPLTAGERWQTVLSEDRLAGLDLRVRA